MVNRERFMLDLDSEGFSIVESNIGKMADVGVAQALLADHKCLQCEPRVVTFQDRPLSDEEREFIRRHEELHKAYRNPEGWQEVDGIALPPITWAQGISYWDEFPVATPEEKQAAADHFLKTRFNIETFNAALDAHSKHVVEINLDLIPIETQHAVTRMGIEELSDELAHEAFFGWKK